MFNKVVSYILDNIPDYKYDENDFTLYDNGDAKGIIITRWKVKGLKKPTTEQLESASNDHIDDILESFNTENEGYTKPNTLKKDGDFNMEPKHITSKLFVYSNDSRTKSKRSVIITMPSAIDIIKEIYDPYVGQTLNMSLTNDSHKDLKFEFNESVESVYTNVDSPTIYSGEYVVLSFRIKNINDGLEKITVYFS